MRTQTISLIIVIEVEVEDGAAAVTHRAELLQEMTLSSSRTKSPLPKSQPGRAGVAFPLWETGDLGLPSASDLNKVIYEQIQCGQGCLEVLKKAFFEANRLAQRKLCLDQFVQKKNESF